MQGNRLAPHVLGELCYDFRANPGSRDDKLGCMGPVFVWRDGTTDLRDVLDIVRTTTATIPR
jgi:hypothetical protein